MVVLVINGLARHPVHGVGRVVGMSADSAIVSFTDGTDRECPIGELAPAHANGFWVFLHTDREGLLRLVEQSRVAAVILILRDLGGKARAPDIARAFESLPLDWDTWWEEAREALPSSPAIDSSRAREGVYAVADEAAAHIEVLLASFRVHRVLRSVGGDHAVANPAKIDAARRLMVAVSRTKTAIPEVRTSLVSYIQSVCEKGTANTADQVDLLLRCNELGWLPESELHQRLVQLCAQPILVYELGRYAQNRIIDVLLSVVGYDIARSSVLTAFAADSDVVTRVGGRLCDLGHAEDLLEGLWVGLTENLVDDRSLGGANLDSLRRWYDSFRSRLAGLGRVLDDAVFVAELQIDMRRLADLMRGLVQLLSRMAVREEPPEELVANLVTFWRRALRIASPQERECVLEIIVAGPLHDCILGPMLRALFVADRSLQLADGVLERLRESGWAHAKAVLEYMASQHWAWEGETGALQYIADRLSTWDEAMNWVLERASGVIRANRNELPGYLPLLDRLDATDSVDKERVQGLRQEAVHDLCRALGQGDPPIHAPFQFDGAALAGVAAYLDEMRREAHLQLELERSRAAELQEMLRSSEQTLAEREAALEDLRRGYRQPDQEIRYAERRRILEIFAGATAELERYAVRSCSREMTGVVRRLNSLLQRFGVLPYGDIGERVVFDPADHAFVGEGERTVDTVVVTERGYRITGLDGTPRVLRPARVAAKPGGSSS